MLEALVVAGSIPAGILIAKFTRQEVQQGKKFLVALALVFGAAGAFTFITQGWTNSAPYFFISGIPLGSLLYSG